MKTSWKVCQTLGLKNRERTRDCKNLGKNVICFFLHSGHEKNAKVIYFLQKYRSRECFITVVLNTCAVAKTCVIVAYGLTNRVLFCCDCCILSSIENHCFVDNIGSWILLQWSSFELACANIHCRILSVTAISDTK
jgi:hypothetical protein